MSPTEVKIGALLPLTGALSSGGQTEKAALNIAIKQINENLSNTNSKIRVSLVAEDTHTDPLVSLEKLKGSSCSGRENSCRSSYKRRAQCGQKLF